MSLRTLNDVFFAVVERQHSKVMLQRLGDEWVPISSATLRERVMAVSGALKVLIIGALAAAAAFFMAKLINGV